MRPLVCVLSLKNQAVIADKCVVADRFWSRLKGLIGRRRFDAGEGMLFPHCKSIHMGWMLIPIDVVFLARVAGAQDRCRVTSVHPNVRPWKLIPLSDWTADDALELPVGSIARHAIELGDELCINSQ